MMNYEQYAIYKRPRKGKCKNSCFANGWHRVGMVAVQCVLDGALAGDIAQEICLECGKMFDTRAFIHKVQPNRFKEGEVK